MDNIVELNKTDVYQKNNLIISNVNLTVKKSDFFYIIGKSGSGKSSLLKTIYADLPLINGMGQVVGFNLRKINRENIPFLRRKIGIIFQDFQLLYDRNVYENLRFILRATEWKNENLIKRRIEKILDMLGIFNLCKSMPFQLSGGEQQRVVIARALINDPQLIIADEPTGNIDPDTSKIILDLLFKIQKEGTAIMMATHDYRLIKENTKVLKIENGRIYEISNMLN